MINKKYIFVLFNILLALILAPPDKEATSFAIDVGAIVSSKETGMMKPKYKASFQGEGTTVNIDSEQSPLEFKQKSTSGVLARVKFFGFFGLGVATHKMTFEQKDYESTDKAPINEITSNYFEILGHVPIPFLDLTLSGNFGGGTRKYLFKKSESSTGKDVSTSLSVTKYGVDIGFEHGFLFNLRYSFGYHSVQGKKKIVDIKEVEPEYTLLEVQFDPNATFLTFTLGIGF